MAGQEMQVRWRHHQIGLLTYLRQMLTSEVFVDVTLCCQNRRLKAHRVLLSASSPYLQELLLAHPVSDHTTIILDDINYEDMKSLLDFVYTGGVTIPESRLESFLNAAQTLHITVLTDKTLHQQLPTEDVTTKSPLRHEEKTIPPLIKFDHDKNVFMHSFRPNKELNPLHFNTNGFKINSMYKMSPNQTDMVGEDKEYTRKISHNNNYDEVKTAEFRKNFINENDVKPPARDLWNNVEFLRQNELEENKKRNIHDSFKIHPSLVLPHHRYPIKQNLSRSDFMDTSPSQEIKEFPWTRRPIPSLRPISMVNPVLGSGPFVRKLAPPKRAGGILTPSPWSQSGRPPVGAPRIVRAERTEQIERNEDLGKSMEHLTDANNTSSASTVSVPSSPKLKTLLSNSSEKEAEQNSNSPSPGYTTENDENRPQYNSDVIKLCRLKERRLQDFYREQMLSNGVHPNNGRIDLDKNTDYDEANDLSLKKSTIPLFGDQENYVNFHANRLHHITRILGTDNSKTGEEVNPLHGLKTLANLLDDKTGPVLQRRRSLSCSDLAEDNVLRPNDTNNNEEEKTNGMEEDVDESKGNHSSLSCEDCGKVFGRRQLLVQHRRIHTGERPYVCGACGKQFTQRGHWTAHQKLHEDSRQPEHSCSQCGKAFVTRASLKVHLRTHTGEKPFHCLECGKQFSQLRNYKYHRSVHEGTREFAATCPECGKYFNDRGYLSSHMKIHRNRKEYGCEYCGKSFNQRVAYNMHVRIHTGEKPHVCQHCNKSFSRKMLLKQHLRIHTGEKPFSCVVCQKAFADRSNMTLHMRLHSGVKPYTCSVCAKSFTKKHHLKTHMNYHTGVKPYVCSKCGLRFSQSSNMRTHYKKCSVATYQNIPTPPSSVSTTANSIPSSSPLQHMTTTSGVTPPHSDESSSSSSIVKDNAEHPQ